MVKLISTEKCLKDLTYSIFVKIWGFKYVNYYIPIWQSYSTRSQPIQFVPTMQKNSLRHHYYTLSNTWLLIAVIIVVQDFSRIATMITGRSVCGVSQGSAYCLISRAHQYIYIFCRMALKLDLHIYGISLSAHSSVCHHMQACSFFLLFWRRHTVGLWLFVFCCFHSTPPVWLPGRSVDTYKCN